MERTASRSTMFTPVTGLGLAGSLAALICMAIDQATGDSVRAHVIDLYTPFGTVPDPMIPWIALYATFAAGAICWGIALWGAWRKARWARVFSTVAFLLGGTLLVFLFMASEHDTAILPAAWRIVCLSTAIYEVIVMLVAWLPATGRIKA